MNRLTASELISPPRMMIAIGATISCPKLPLMNRNGSRPRAVAHGRHQDGSHAFLAPLSTPPRSSFRLAAQREPEGR